MKNVITSKCCSIPQILLQILTWEGETYRLIYNLSTFGGVRSLKIRQIIRSRYGNDKVGKRRGHFHRLSSHDDL